MIDDLTIQVNRKKMKNMILRICPTLGTVKISAPLRSSNIAIRRFIEANIQWIQKQLLAFRSAPPAHIPLYTTGEKHYFQGRDYVLHVHERAGKSSIHFNEEGIHLFVPSTASREYREKKLMAFYRDHLLKALDTLIPFWEQKIGVKAAHYQIRRMTSRWGTCHPVKRKICLNLSLIKYPLACLEYVIAHELIHLLEPSHNARFKALMSQFMPDWRIHKGILDNAYRNVPIF